LRVARRFFPVITDHDQPHFWVRRDGKRYVTSLSLVLLVIGSTDIMFALDSIPAVFGVTQDTFIVITSNVFAVLGLRSMYFVVATALQKLRYLQTGLAVLLGFIGVKMIVEEALEHHWTEWGIKQLHRSLISLGAVAVILGFALVASLVAGPEPSHELP